MNQATNLQEAAVKSMRAKGNTFAAIGRALGITYSKAQHLARRGTPEYKAHQKMTNTRHLAKRGAYDGRYISPLEPGLKVYEG